MEQTDRQCNIRITARYTLAIIYIYIPYIYLYNNIYIYFLYASCAFIEDFRLDRSFGFCEKKKVQRSFCAICFVRNFFVFFFFFSLRFSTFRPSFLLRFRVPVRTPDEMYNRCTNASHVSCFMVSL